MSRLTNSTREAITQAAVAFAFDPKKEALAKEEDMLAREAHMILFPKKLIDTVKSLPAGWIRHLSGLKFNAGGQKIELVASEALPVPAFDKGNNNCTSGYYIVGTILPGDDLCDRIQGHAQAKERYETERRNAYRQTYAMLESVTTIKKLREAWPEGEQFFKKYEDAPAPQVPALRVDEINSILGLPAAA